LAPSPRPVSPATSAGSGAGPGGAGVVAPGAASVAACPSGAVGAGFASRLRAQAPPWIGATAPPGGNGVASGLASAVASSCVPAAGASSSAPPEMGSKGTTAKATGASSAPGCLSCGGHRRGGLPLMRCSRCREAAYCSVSCQKEDYPSHRLSCSSHAPAALPAPSGPVTGPCTGCGERFRRGMRTSCCGSPRLFCFPCQLAHVQAVHTPRCGLCGGEGCRFLCNCSSSFCGVPCFKSHREGCENFAAATAAKLCSFCGGSPCRFSCSTCSFPHYCSPACGGKFSCQYKRE
jgi:hypothetical protein